MTRGVKLLLGAAVLAMAGCASEGGKLEIRSTPTPQSMVAKPLTARMAEAHAQLRLGNVALALESFRRAVREEPASADALVGVATCYDLMGRHDLSRRNFEAALALAPADATVLTAFASSLDTQGRREEAANMRAELHARVAAQALAEASLVDPELGATPSLASTAPVALSNTVTLRLPEPLPVQSATPARPAAAAPALAQAVQAPPGRSAPDGEGPRLQRLSMGEVALVTTVPQWRPAVVARTAQSTTIRFVPLKPAVVRTANLRLLNAARYQGLAATTRDYLKARGWREVAIGDAPRARDQSVILYPASRKATAERLAAQFGFAVSQRASGHELVMLLGRDAARVNRARAGA